MKRNQKGFTLMEMLIVVAIIAILVAVSIPVFTSQLEKARDATDMANERAAKAVVVARYLTDDLTAATYRYDAADGTLKADTVTVAAYGKSTSATSIGTTEYPNDGVHTSCWIEVTVDANGNITALSWEK